VLSTHPNTAFVSEGLPSDKNFLSEKISILGMSSSESRGLERLWIATQRAKVNQLGCFFFA